MTHTETQSSFWKRVLIAGFLVALLGLLIAVSAAEAADSNRLDRKVRVMERVLDEVLIQSEHIAVQPGGNSRGLVLEGFGALFVVEGNLGFGVLPTGHFGLLERDERGNIFFSADSKIREEAEPEERVDWKQQQKQAEEKRNQRLEAIQAELADTLIDYGATLGELPPDQWVAVALFLGEREFLASRDDGSQVIVKVKMRDLKSYAAGSLSRDAVLKKVEIEGP